MFSFELKITAKALNYKMAHDPRVIKVGHDHNDREFAKVRTTAI